MVNGKPILKKSQKEIEIFSLLSALWNIMILLAAPMIVMLPAIVLPTASAINPAIDTPACCSKGK
jgi:hypothetical protein